GQSFSVTDSRGHVYQQAVQFDVTSDLPSGSTLGIFYAPAISGGANTVTVSMPTAVTLRFAILEYAGVATTNVLDGATATQGTSATPSSGPVTTATNGDLLPGAIMTADPATFSAGSGYTLEESIPGAPNTKLIAEDQIQTTAGAAAASATLSTADVWGAAVAAFRAASDTTLNVLVSPKRSALTTSQTQQFTATVKNAPQNGGVTWLVDGTAGGSAVTGSITSAGL